MARFDITVEKIGRRRLGEKSILQAARRQGKLGTTTSSPCRPLLTSHGTTSSSLGTTRLCKIPVTPQIWRPSHELQLQVDRLSRAVVTAALDRRSAAELGMLVRKRGKSGMDLTGGKVGSVKARGSDTAYEREITLERVVDCGECIYSGGSAGQLDC